MGIQPSASRTALLLACPRPFDEEVEEGPDLPGEPARYGSAFHAVLAECLRVDKTGGKIGKKPLERTDRFAREVDTATAKYDVKAVTHELAGHVKSSAGVLRNWLKREKLEVYAVEEAYAVELRNDDVENPWDNWDARKIPPHDEDHHYLINQGEIAGTVDLIAHNEESGRAVVIDHKTGSGDEEKFAQPASIPQMRTLGLMAAAPHFTDSAEVGIFHADRRGLPIVYAEPYQSRAQANHAAELHAALGRIGQGFLRPGPQCKRCPARVTCPAWAADLLAESTAALVASANTLAIEPIDPTSLYATLRVVEEGEAPLALEVRAGALYELLKKFRALDKAGTEEIRRLVRAGSIVEMRDGKVLTLQKQTYETLSKKSVIEALGKVDGEKELARLRKKGAIREATREMLVPEK